MLTMQSLPQELDLTTLAEESSVHSALPHSSLARWGSQVAENPCNFKK